MKVAIIGYGAFGRAAAYLFSNHDHECFIISSKGRNLIDEKFKIHVSDDNNNYDCVISARRTSHDLSKIFENEKILTNLLIDISTNPISVVDAMYKFCERKSIIYVELPQLGSSISLEQGQSTSLAFSDTVHQNNLEKTIKLFGENYILLEQKFEPTKLKIIHNFLAAGYLSLYKSIFGAADKNKISRKVLSHVLDLSPLSTKLLNAKKNMIIAGKYSQAQFSVDNMLKDINLFEDLLNTNEDNKSLNFVKEVFENAIEKGFQNFDTSSVVQ